MQERLKHVKEIQEIIASTNAFMKERNKVVTDLDNDDGVRKEEFYQQLAMVERAKALVNDLPKPGEMTAVGDLSTKVAALDGQIQTMLESMGESMVAQPASAKLNEKKAEAVKTAELTDEKEEQ